MHRGPGAGALAAGLLRRAPGAWPEPWPVEEPRRMTRRPEGEGERRPTGTILARERRPAKARRPTGERRPAREQRQTGSDVRWTSGGRRGSGRAVHATLRRRFCRGSGRWGIGGAGCGLAGLGSGVAARIGSETLDLLYTELLGSTCQRVCGFADSDIRFSNPLANIRWV